MTEWTDETEWFYLGDDGVENVGPFNVTEMAGFHQDGGIDAETWIWNETMEGWKQLSDYQEFSEYLEGLSYMANMSVEDDAKPSSEEAVDAPAALPAMPQVPDEKRRSASREKARRTSVMRSNTTKNGLARFRTRSRCRTIWPAPARLSPRGVRCRIRRPGPIRAPWVPR